MPVEKVEIYAEDQDNCFRKENNYSTLTKNISEHIRRHKTRLGTPCIHKRRDRDLSRETEIYRCKRFASRC